MVVRRHSAGFTLLEMLAVMVLMGVAAAAIAVSVSHGLAAARVHAASRDVAAALRYTRLQAIVHAQSEVFELDATRRSYHAPGRPAHSLPPGMRVAMTSAAEDRTNNHTGRIRFFPDGSSTGGRVTLRRGAREWHVNVAWLTGAVSVVRQ
jgi:general secretion pathway protein H